jgi:integrase
MVWWDPKRKQHVASWGKGKNRKYQRMPRGMPKAEVKDYEDRMRLADFRGRDEAPTFKEYYPRYQRILPRIRHQEASTRLKEDGMVRDHLAPFLDHLKLDQITAGLVMNLQVKLSEGDLREDRKPLAAQSVNNVMAALSKILGVAVIEGILPHNAVKSVPRVRREPRKPQFWTFEENNRFLGYCMDQDWELFQLCCFAVNTGLRPGELQGLQRECLNFEESYVKVDRNWCTKTKKINDYTKNRVERRISLSPPVWRVMLNKRNLEAKELVFSMNFNALGHNRIKPMAQSAGVKEIRFHDLRHTFGSHLMMLGKDIKVIQELMGHKKLSSTEIYVHITEDYLKGATDVMMEKQTWNLSGEAKVVPITSQ